jgi:hypothetical protein
MMLHDDAEATDAPSFEAGELPQPCHPMAATANPTFVHGPPQLDRAIPFSRLLMELPQHWEEPLILGRTGTDGAISPGIVPAATDGERRA